VRASKPRSWTELPAVIAAWTARVRRDGNRLMLRVAQRRIRERRAMVSVPLALSAALIAGVWWLVPVLALCAWWWAPSGSWEWLEALGRGAVTVEWALVGAGALAAFPAERLSVGAAWVALPLAFVTCTGRRRGRD
jgi:hypothetical protein